MDTVSNKLNGPPLPAVERSISKPVSLSAWSVQLRSIRSADIAVAVRFVGAAGASGGVVAQATSVKLE
jgi:hypothetical protein